jgi:GntR family transcriptional regulator/MocR family aminotransferase
MKVLGSTFSPCLFETPISNVPGLPVSVTKGAGCFLQKSLIRSFKAAIDTGELSPGQQLPSSRELARMLDISRATAVRVYLNLISQGYIDTAEGIGTFVRTAETLNPKTKKSDFQIKFSNYEDIYKLKNPESLSLLTSQDLNDATGIAQCLPIEQWRRILTKADLFTDQNIADYKNEEFGLKALRENISGYLARTRLMECHQELVAVCNSPRFLFHVLSQILVSPGDVVAFPEPGPLHARKTFENRGAKLLSIALNDDGIDIDQLVSSDVVPKILYLNNQHAEPNGARLSLQKKHMIVDWAERKGVLIIEDDYDAEFRYSTGPSPSLMALSSVDNVVYLSNFQRTLYPIANVNFICMPQSMKSIFAAIWSSEQALFNTRIPFTDQVALSSFLSSGEYEKHVRRIQTVYAKRWRTAVYKLTQHFGRLVKINMIAPANYVYARFDLNVQDEIIIKCAKEAGLNIVSMRDWYRSARLSGAFLIRFVHLNDEEIAAKVSQFEQSISKQVVLDATASAEQNPAYSAQSCNLNVSLQCASPAVFRS